MADDTPESGSSAAQGSSGSKGAKEPKGPTDLPKKSWRGVLTRTVREYKEDELSDGAAALTYYGVLAVFPALLALVSIIGLTGKANIQSLIKNVGGLAPGSVRSVLDTMLTQLQSSQASAGVGLLVGILLALWSASGYVAAFMRASNRVYDIGEGRPVWKTLPTRFAITVVVVVLTAAIAVGVVFTGTLARKPDRSSGWATRASRHGTTPNGP